ncbi:MAG: rhodanese-like domain-containing protein [Cylindrospermopsis raciborskii KL1]|uniref:rhodanese-like domain-containing protein n=1 Tax=Cylindrospermopsis raciborskii TaxID=77022 RepID=UPI001A230910|nr:rhodanese-like domain-containing protein [Cylindrospermopsis raciborskii]MBG0743631.1 rhodanese-like domain-containing protein [Cylindrospermopsis raciborskii KL1]
MEISGKEELQALDASQVKELLENQRVHLIDVREQEEFMGEHIPGSQLLPLSKLDPEKISLLTGKKIVLYCHSGNRSKQAAHRLIEFGFRDFSELQGGISAWKKSGYVTNKNNNAPISIMRQVQIVAGTLVVTGTVLGVLVSPWFLILSGFIGTGLVFAGLTNTCTMAMLLKKLPYNQRG